MYPSTLRQERAIDWFKLMGIGFHPSIRPMTTRRFVKFRSKRKLQLASCLQWLSGSRPSPDSGLEPSGTTMLSGIQNIFRSPSPLTASWPPLLSICGVPLTLIVLYHRIFDLSSKILKIFKNYLSYLKIKSALYSLTTPTYHSKTVSPCPKLQETLDLFQHYTLH